MTIKKFVESSNSALLLILIVPLLSLITNNGFNYYALFIVLIGVGVYYYNNRVMGKVWSINVEKKKTLVKEGCFKYIRHPLYLGSIITAFGVSLFLNSTTGLLFNFFVTIPFLYYRAVLEERLLSKTLKGYKNYMKNTGRFLPKLK